MGLRRKIDDILREWKGDPERKSLLIQGARQIGKTYSIRRFADENYRTVVYMDFSADPTAREVFDGDLNVDTIVTRISGMFPDAEIVPYDTVFILDEVQECPRARSAMKPFSDDPRYDIIASGSLLGLKLSRVPIVPVGKQNRIWMYPLDFEEFLWALGISDQVITHVRACIRDRVPLGESLHSTLMKYMNWYILTGGMPEAVSEFVRNRTFDNVRKVQSDIIEDYQDDMDKHCEDRERLRTRMCFESISRFLGKDNKRFAAAAVDPGLGYRPASSLYDYAVNWLLQAGVVYECRRVSNPLIPAEESGVETERPDVEVIDGDGSPGTFKLYFMDTGLLARMYDPSVYSQILSGNVEVNRGALTENLVACMLKAQGRKLLYFERTRKIEIDFVMVIGGRPTAVEVKSGRKRSCRSLNKAMSDYGMRGIMFDTLDIYTDDKGVEHFPLYAAAFMDEIDPSPDLKVDIDGVEELNRMFDGKA